MATLSVLSCKYDGEHLIAKLKVEVLDIKAQEIWSKRRTNLYSNVITLFTPINNIPYKYCVRFYRNDDEYIVVSYNTDKRICSIYHSDLKNPNDYVKEFEIIENILKMDADERNDLAEDLRQNSQFTINCKAKTFTVNKAILQARSPVFCAMISNNFKEGKESRVGIDDFEPEIVEKMIEFCETDNVKENKGHEVELYKIAGKYQIESFMIYTRELLKFIITFENSCELLKFAQMHVDSKLEEFLLSWIRPNIQHIRKTQGFLAFSNDEIAEIFR